MLEKLPPARAIQRSLLNDERVRHAQERCCELYGRYLHRLRAAASAPPD